MMGLNTSAELRRGPSRPPAIKTPEIKHYYVPPLTDSQGDDCKFTRNIETINSSSLGGFTVLISVVLVKAILDRIVI